MAWIGWINITRLRVRLSRMERARTSSIATTQPHRHERRPAPRQKKTGHTGEDVGNRVDDAVAVVAKGNRRGSISIDDLIGVLVNLPRGLEGHDDNRGKANRRRPQRQPSQPIECRAVDDVRERVRIEDLLRVLIAADITGPESDGPVLIGRRSAHGEFQDDGQGDHGRGNRDVAQEAPPAMACDIQLAAGQQGQPRDGDQKWRNDAIQHGRNLIQGRRAARRAAGRYA